MDFLTIAEAADALRRGDITSLELTEQAIARSDALDAQLGVFLARFDDEARATAVGVDADFAAGIDRGPLQGIPIGMKDIFAMREGPTTANSLVLDTDWGKDRDAVVVDRLRNAGAVITGKLTTMEFASGLPDRTKPFPLPRNPWNPEHWGGGSSSGSGIGVAAGMFLAAIGTDTGGSIRLPAIYCGITGLMPTFGRVPAAGCVPLGFSLDHVGPLARSARDCGAVLNAIAGYDGRDPYAVDRPVEDFLGGLTNGGSLAGLRIGLERANHLGESDDPAVEPAFEAAVEVLTSLGAEVVPVTIPNYNETVMAALVTTMSEALAYHRNDLRTRAEDYTASIRTMFPLGACFTGADYVQAQRVRRVAQRGLATLFSDVDLIVAPAASRVAPTLKMLLDGDMMTVLGGVHTMFWDAVGHPVMVVPMGFNVDGMPLSLQLAASPFEETLLIRAGDAYQQQTDWHRRVAPLVVGSASDRES